MSHFGQWGWGNNNRGARGQNIGRGPRFSRPSRGPPPFGKGLGQTHNGWMPDVGYPPPLGNFGPRPQPPLHNYYNDRIRLGGGPQGIYARLGAQEQTLNRNGPYDSLGEHRDQNHGGPNYQNRGMYEDQGEGWVCQESNYAPPRDQPGRSGSSHHSEKSTYTPPRIHRERSASLHRSENSNYSSSRDRHRSSSQHRSEKREPERRSRSQTPGFLREKEERDRVRSSTPVSYRRKSEELRLDISPVRSRTPGPYSSKGSTKSSKYTPHKKEPIEGERMSSLIWGMQDAKPELRNLMKQTKKEDSPPPPPPHSPPLKTLPPFDGSTILGEEGIQPCKLFKCFYCSMLCVDSSSVKKHLLTRYHYKRYSDYVNINADVSRVSAADSPEKMVLGRGENDCKTPSKDDHDSKRRKRHL